MSLVHISSVPVNQDHDGRKGARRLLVVPEATVRRMRAALRAQTADCISATFGISMNTWTKVRDGQPIRRSVAERLLERLDASGQRDLN